MIQYKCSFKKFEEEINMSNWKDMAKRLRENQERNLSDYEKQYSKADERKKFFKQMEVEQAKVLSNSRRKRNFEKTTVQKDFEK